MEFDWDKLRAERLEFEFSVGMVCMGDHPDIINMIENETLPAILKNVGNEKFELIISDNTKDPSGEYVNFLTRYLPSLHYPTRVILNGENTGCVGGWNSMFKQCRGKYIAGFASDYLVGTPDFLRKMSQPMEVNDKIACTSHRVARSNSNCDGQPFPDVQGTFVTAAALDGLMLRRSALEKIGYIDEDIWPYMGEDMSLGIQLNEAGYCVMKVELPGDVHLGQRSVHTRKNPRDDNSSVWPRSSTQSMWDRNRRIMMEKHKEFLNRKCTWNESKEIS